MSANVDLVKAWVDACNAGDIEAAVALCGESMELIEAEALPGAVTATGIDQVRRYLERFDAHWSEGEWMPQEFVETDNTVMMRARLRLVGRMSGIEVDREWIYLFAIRDGQLLSQRGFDDRAEAIRAAGITG